MIPAKDGADAEVPPVEINLVFGSLVWQEVNPDEIKSAAQIK
jgi:hypothetical protein